MDLPTQLEDRFLSIDIARFGGLIDFRINGFTGLAVSNVIADDGVVQVVPSVLIPPKTPHSDAKEGQDEQMTVEELMERLEPFVEEEAVAERALGGREL